MRCARPPLSFRLVFPSHEQSRATDHEHDVVRTSAWRSPLCAVRVLDHVDQGIAADDDQGRISPELRLFIRVRPDFRRLGGWWAVGPNRGGVLRG
jgi:hypothetical protein